MSTSTIFMHALGLVAIGTGIAVSLVWWWVIGAPWVAKRLVDLEWDLRAWWRNRKERRP